MKNMYLPLLIVSLVLPSHLFAHSGACDTKKRNVFPVECKSSKVVSTVGAASGVVGAVTAEPACVEYKYRQCKEAECMPAYNAAYAACKNQPLMKRGSCKKQADENYKSCFNNVAVRGY